MRKSDVILSLNALSQMVKPHGSVLNRTAAVTIGDQQQLDRIAKELGAEPNFAAVMHKVQTDEAAVTKIQEIYAEWQKTAAEGA